MVAEAFEGTSLVRCVVALNVTFGTLSSSLSQKTILKSYDNRTKQST